jgi:hypothetical protein
MNQPSASPSPDWYPDPEGGPALRWFNGMNTHRGHRRPRDRSRCSYSRPGLPDDAQGVQGPFTVTKVVDGDTIWVDNNGQRMKIRMIGLDTPESVDPRKPVQCFGLEASAQAKTILGGQSVSRAACPAAWARRGGHYCDGWIYPDGSYDHTVIAMGFWQSSRVCPPDPGQPRLPAAMYSRSVCQFRK